MNCLVCGHKLAIFRKLSLGDFCCQEHRGLFQKEQSSQGLARLMESSSESRIGAAGTRVYAQFFHEELPASRNGDHCRGYGPLSLTRVMALEVPAKYYSGLAPAPAMVFVAPQEGAAGPVGFDFSGFNLKLPGKQEPLWSSGGITRLRPSGLILPWSSGAGSLGGFSLVAAAWAQAGNSKPIAPHDPLGAIQFAWPAVKGKVELPAATSSIAPAAFAAIPAPSSQPMRVRLNTPGVVSHAPQLELNIPAQALIADTEISFEAVPVRPSVPAPKESFLSSLFRPRPRKIRLTRTRPRLRDREDTFGYNEPAPTVSSSSRDAWREMLTGWTPSAGATSGVFAVLFLFSALGIFFSAPSALSERPHSWRWGNLLSAIRGRAVLKVEDDFRSGLNRWIGPAGWSQDWSYDRAGFLRPGKLGFLQQSMSLVNYRMEFMGQIERKSLGWVFRAKDERNYYVAKLTVARPGPLPLVDLIHYAVTNGKEGAKMRIALPFSVRNDTLYQVEMNIRGDQFRASVNGRMVDSWSDKLLQAGGVGFLSGQGEASRVRWIRVSDRDDVIGRVCSYLTARAYRPAGEVLSSSYYTFLAPPGHPADF